jgi:hypothetical protein
MIQGRKDYAFTSGDFPVGCLHVVDNSFGIFQDMAVTVDDSRAKVSAHPYVPPMSLEN